MLAIGMTEVGRTIQVLNSESKTLKNKQTIGRPVPGTQIKIINSYGESLEANQVGEICVKSDQVTPGYLNNEDANLELFTVDGYLRTGDAGYFDEDGLFYVVLRYKDIIKVEEMSVSPFELESILLSHEAVEDAAVIGIPDEERGEVPKAFVMLKHAFEISEKSLEQYFNDKVSPIKQLRGGIQFVDNFPRSRFGKIKKSELRMFDKK
jgi:4-coumarate--CoA ligase